jgi:hypothetical protein
MAFEKALARLTLLSLLLAAGCSSAPPGASPSFDPRICALVTGCMGTAREGVGPWCQSVQQVEAGASPNGPHNISHETLTCVAASTTCAEVTACLSDTPAEIAACNGNGTSQCSGDVLVECSLGMPASIYDCAQDGQHCFQGASGALCGLGTCDPTTTPASCQGDVLVSCASIGTATEPSVVLVSTECSKERGWTIVTNADSCDGSGACESLYADTCGVVGGVVQCMGSGAACDPSTYVASCSGTVVSACTGGKVAQFDCASLGPFTCQGSYYPSCGNAGTECQELDAETCQDGLITYCLWGTKQTMDCKTYGFSGCTTIATQGGGKPGAQCTL